MKQRLVLGRELDWASIHADLPGMRLHGLYLTAWYLAGAKFAPEHVNIFTQAYQRTHA